MTFYHVPLGETVKALFLFHRMWKGVDLTNTQWKYTANFTVLTLLYTLLSVNSHSVKYFLLMMYCSSTGFKDLPYVRGGLQSSVKQLG